MRRIDGSEMPRRTVLVAAAALVFAGAARAQVSPADPPPPDPPPSELEPVRAVVAGPRGLMVRVTSHGCTSKTDFAHYVEPRGDAVTVAFARKRLDRCGGRRGELEILFSYEELGVARGQPLVVLNPIGR